MANKIITFIIDTVEPELDSILAAAINEIHTLGHKVKEIRVADDAGETKVATNQVEGVTVHAPVTDAPATAAPEPTTAVDDEEHVNSSTVPEPEPEPADDPGEPVGGGSIPDPNLPEDVPPTPSA